MRKLLLVATTICLLIIACRYDDIWFTGLKNDPYAIDKKNRLNMVHQPNYLKASSADNTHLQDLTFIHGDYLMQKDRPPLHHPAQIVEDASEDNAIFSGVASLINQGGKLQGMRYADLSALKHDPALFQSKTSFCAVGLKVHAENEWKKE